VVHNSAHAQPALPSNAPDYGTTLHFVWLLTLSHASGALSETRFAMFQENAPKSSEILAPKNSESPPTAVPKQTEIAPKNSEKSDVSLSESLRNATRTTASQLLRCATGQCSQGFNNPENVRARVRSVPVKSASSAYVL
jgi:hypothetical protein